VLRRPAAAPNSQTDARKTTKPLKTDANKTTKPRKTDAKKTSQPPKTDDQPPKKMRQVRQKPAPTDEGAGDPSPGKETTAKLAIQDNQPGSSSSAGAPNIERRQVAHELGDDMEGEEEEEDWEEGDESDLEQEEAEESQGDEGIGKKPVGKTAGAAPGSQKKPVAPKTPADRGSGPSPKEYSIMVYPTGAVAAREKGKGGKQVFQARGGRVGSLAPDWRGGAFRGRTAGRALNSKCERRPGDALSVYIRPLSWPGLREGRLPRGVGGDRRELHQGAREGRPSGRVCSLLRGQVSQNACTRHRSSTSLVDLARLLLGYHREACLQSAASQGVSIADVKFAIDVQKTALSQKVAKRAAAAAPP
jgi:hypothetical protein